MKDQEYWVVIGNEHLKLFNPRAERKSLPGDRTKVWWGKGFIEKGTGRDLSISEDKNIIINKLREEGVTGKITVKTG